jgi:hypothetical protein
VRAIIVDFCEKGEGHFENDLPAMDILREEVLRATAEEIPYPTR